MKDHLRKCVTSVLLVCVVLNCCSCGTLMHPERKGQQSGKIDPKIAILDGVGLLFFIVPGVIAFAVECIAHIDGRVLQCRSQSLYEVPG